MPKSPYRHHLRPRSPVRATLTYLVLLLKQGNSCLPRPCHLLASLPENDFDFPKCEPGSLPHFFQVSAVILCPQRDLPWASSLKQLTVSLPQSLSSTSRYRFYFCTSLHGFLPAVLTFLHLLIFWSPHWRVSFTGERDFIMAFPPHLECSIHAP